MTGLRPVPFRSYHRPALWLVLVRSRRMDPLLDPLLTRDCLCRTLSRRPCLLSLPPFPYVLLRDLGLASPLSGVPLVLLLLLVPWLVLVRLRVC